MKKMLFITPRIPIPADGGGLIGTRTSIEFFAKYFDIDYVSFIDPKTDKETKKIELKKLGIKNVYFIEYTPKKRNFKTIIKSLFSSIPLSIIRNNSKAMKEFISSIGEKYDYVYADHWLSWQFVKNLKKPKKILKEHNAEYVMWERISKIENNFWKKIYLNLQIKKIKKYEASICNQVDYVIVVTDDDKNKLIEIGANGSNIYMLPAVIVKTNSQPIVNFNERDNFIMYVGTMSWDANVDGLNCFLENVYPIVKNKIPNIKFYIIGKNPPNSIKKIAEKDSSIVVTGYVKDLDEYYNKCKLFVVYLRYGSGIKIKILDSLSKGMPVISDKVGLEGIDTQATILSTTNEDFAQNIINTINNNEVLLKMSKEAILYSATNYCEDKYIEFNNLIQNDQGK